MRTAIWLKDGIPRSTTLVRRAALAQRLLEAATYRAAVLRRARTERARQQGTVTSAGTTLRNTA
ncbi:hypothetical protein [Streptomyces sp. WAC01526]|uniref:hypothetical protein n=1 Tax=Streptomyces sp. WAC01526 TaxID=2588709 RepID=UPI0011DF4A89|nr:hypothetical protein [Streptomyces sp. WAC01526]